MAQGSAPSSRSRIASFWRRALVGPYVGARIEIYEELAPTLTAGFGIREALQAVRDRHRGAKARAVDLLIQGIDRDVPLSETMLSNPDVFSVLEAALVATGERTGRLDVAFKSAAAQLERSRAARNKIIQSFAYPALVIHVFVLMVGTVLMFKGGSFLKIVVPSLLLLWGGFAAAVSLHVAWSVRTGYAKFLERTPVLGRALLGASLARFARTFAALHGAGVTYDESLRIAADASGSATLRADAAAVTHALSRGAQFPQALGLMSSLPPDDRGLLIAGEQSGELESAANRVATLEEERSDVVSRRATSVLPGCLVMICGVAIAAFAVWFYADYYSQIDKMLK